MIDSLYFLQFACFIFMLINALILGITHLHMKWDNRRYEWSRYFTSCLNSTFRIWLAEVRFEAAKKMMLDYPAIATTSFQPNVASPPVPISIAYSKRKKVAPQQSGEQKYNKIMP